MGVESKECRDGRGGITKHLQDIERQWWRQMDIALYILIYGRRWALCYCCIVAYRYHHKKSIPLNDIMFLISIQVLRPLETSSVFLHYPKKTRLVIFTIDQCIFVLFLNHNGSPPTSSKFLFSKLRNKISVVGWIKIRCRLL